ncbi:hypothetical protein [Leucobacter sp. cx-169]|uniref:hypothetical protein n=1 Tax=Leucobacter sp. cx-169 TaxID=2770549 RepID=UPI00165E8BEF|nr:hypothetical protein [Leucobacter sp. cx-169]MBC9927168.1 hypothetical protein [Leucobacter sp. cx-169]
MVSFNDTVGFDQQHVTDQETLRSLHSGCGVIVTDADGTQRRGTFNFFKTTRSDQYEGRGSWSLSSVHSRANVTFYGHEWDDTDRTVPFDSRIEKSTSTSTGEDLENFLIANSAGPTKRRKASTPKAYVAPKLSPDGKVKVGALVTVNNGATDLPGEWLVISLAPNSGVHLQNAETGEVKGNVWSKSCTFIGDATKVTAEQELVLI